MQFKWVKRFCAVSLVLSSGSAFALSITLKNKGGAGANATTFHFAAYLPFNSSPDDAPQSQIDTEGGFGLVNMNKDEGSDSAGSEAIEFEVTTDIEVDSTKQAVLIASVEDDDGDEQPVPLLASETRVYAEVGNPFGGRTSYLGIKITPGTPLSVKVFPKDICDGLEYKSSGNATDFCTDIPAAGGTGKTVQPTRSTSGTSGIKTVALKFYVYADDSTVTDVTAVPSLSTSTFEESQGVNLKFQIDEPKSTGSCPSLSDVYFPGDGLITLQASRFSAPFTTGDYVSFSEDAAPLQRLFVMANDTGSELGSYTSLPDTRTYTASKYSLVAKVDLSADQTVSGFKNSSPGDLHYHQLVFLARDAAGIFGRYPTTCGVPNVQTAEVQGFLKEGGCFIATATYRSADAPPVRMLREFRDRILMSFELGRAFVRAYYDVSPGLARVIAENPEFRFLAMGLLLPLQWFAYVLLHPLWILVPVAIALAVWLTNLGRSRARRAR